MLLAEGGGVGLLAAPRPAADRGGKDRGPPDHRWRSESGRGGRRPRRPCRLGAQEPGLGTRVGRYLAVGALLGQLEDRAAAAGVGRERATGISAVIGHTEQQAAGRNKNAG